MKESEGKVWKREGWERKIMKRSLGKEKWKEVKLEDARKYQQKSWEENIQEREEKIRRKGATYVVRNEGQMR